MNLTFTFVVAFAVVLLLLFVAIKYIISEKNKNKKLQEELKIQQQNSILLYKHAEEIAEIEKDKNLTDQVIEEAKSDEEILDIINTIVAINNSRVRNNKKDK